MNKLFMTVTISFMLSSFVSAIDLWTEDFSQENIMENAQTTGTWAMDGRNLGNGSDRALSWTGGGAASHATVTGGTLNVGDGNNKYRGAATVLKDLGSSGNFDFNFDLTAASTAQIRIYTADALPVNVNLKSGNDSLDDFNTNGSHTSIALAGQIEIATTTELGQKTINFDYVKGQYILIAVITSGSGDVLSLDNMAIDNGVLQRMVSLFILH